VHLGYPNHNSHSRQARSTRSARQSHNTRQDIARAFDAGAQEPSPAPQSDARRAAEAAFAAPLPAAPDTTQALITVKRARLAVFAQTAPSNAADADAASADAVSAGNPPQAEPPSKQPRVFRVDGGQAKPGSTNPASEGALLQPQSQPKRRRSALQHAHKAAGPVLHVVHSLPAMQRQPLTVTPTPAPTREAITAQMAELTQLLKSIQQLQSLKFIDEQFDKQWHKLLRQAQSVF
jgi:hypothetical protein